jgi:hypothetical protein
MKQLLFISLIALLIVLAIAGWSGGKAHAAANVTTSPAKANTTIIYWSQCGSSDCFGSPNVTYHFSAHWNSGPWAGLGLTAFWGDGGSDGYLCGFNCGTGWAYFSHFYNRSSVWDTWVGTGATGGFGESNDVWMYT